MLSVDLLRVLQDRWFDSLQMIRICLMLAWWKNWVLYRIVELKKKKMCFAMTERFMCKFLGRFTTRCLFSFKIAWVRDVSLVSYIYLEFYFSIPVDKNKLTNYSSFMKITIAFSNMQFHWLYVYIILFWKYRCILQIVRNYV